MQHKVKNKNIKSCIYEKNILYCFQYFTNMFFVVVSQEALAASKEGMQLWLNVLLPVLLPFLILTGILIHTNMAGKLLQPVEVIWNKVLGVSAAGAYAVIVGALCGYPVGAKITSDLYENHQISESEAKYLLTFTNHASPVFVRTYLCHICLKDQIPARTVFGIFALSDLTIMLLFRFVVYRNKIQFLSADKKKKTPVSSSSGAFLDVSIMNGFETVTRLGGYILMFSILSACISHFWNMKNLIGYTLSGILELTTGLCRLQNANIHMQWKYLLTLFLTAFGGICITFQTRSLVTRKLSMLPYITAKLLNGITTVLFALFFSKII